MHKALIYAVCGFVVLSGVIARFAIGNVYGAAEARELIEALSQTGLYLGSAIATASATTLALMLNLLGMSRRSDAEFDDGLYKRISSVSILATTALVGAVILLLLLVMPVGEFEKLPGGWYAILYEVLFAITVGISTLLVATIIQLFLTIRRVISKLTPGDDV